MFTRFCKAGVINRKNPEKDVNAYITIWIAQGFGAPRKVLVDNGGEFDNKEYLDAMEQFNVEVCATAAYSPWSNGTCERNHAVVDLMVDKMLEDDENMNIQVALAYAVSAKNSLQNHHGFAPIQLVTGTLPNLPNILNSDLPALQPAESKLVKNHLDAMTAARMALAHFTLSRKFRLIEISSL